MSESHEVLSTIDRLSAIVADLIVRGLGSVGPGELAPLEAIQTEFKRIGADHLASRIGELVTSCRNGSADAPKALLRAQTSLRLFERILSLKTVPAQLQSLVETES